MLKRTTSTSGVTKVTFAIPLDHAPQSVSVVGEFNGWDPLAHPMRPRSNRTRSVSLELPANRSFEFKYLAADGTWFCDPDLGDVVTNEFGAPNSLLTT